MESFRLTFKCTAYEYTQYWEIVRKKNTIKRPSVDDYYINNNAKIHQIRNILIKLFVKQRQIGILFLFFDRIGVVELRPTNRMVNVFGFGSFVSNVCCVCFFLHTLVFCMYFEPFVDSMIIIIIYNLHRKSFTYNVVETVTVNSMRDPNFRSKP